MPGPALHARAGPRAAPRSLVIYGLRNPGEHLMTLTLRELEVMRKMEKSDNST